MSEALQASNLKSLRFQRSFLFFFVFVLQELWKKKKEIQTCEKQALFTYNYATLKNRLMLQIWDSSSE